MGFREIKKRITNALPNTDSRRPKNQDSTLQPSRSAEWRNNSWLHKRNNSQEHIPLPSTSESQTFNNPASSSNDRQLMISAHDTSDPDLSTSESQTFNNSASSSNDSQSVISAHDTLDPSNQSLLMDTSIPTDLDKTPIARKQAEIDAVIQTMYDNTTAIQEKIAIQEVSKKKVGSWKELKKDCKAVTAEIDQKLRHVLLSPFITFKESYDLISQYCDLQTETYKKVSSKLVNRVTRGIGRDTDEKARAEAKRNIETLQGISNQLDSYLSNAQRLDIAIKAPDTNRIDKRFTEVTKYIEDAIHQNSQAIDNVTYELAKKSFKGYRGISSKRDAIPSFDYARIQKCRRAYLHLRCLEKARDQLPHPVEKQLLVDTSLESSNRKEPKQLKNDIKNVDKLISQEWSHLLSSASPDKLSKIVELVHQYESVIESQINAYNLVSERMDKKIYRGIEGIIDKEANQKLQEKVELAIKTSEAFLQELRRFNNHPSAPESTEPLEAPSELEMTHSQKNYRAILKKLNPSETSDFVTMRETFKTYVDYGKALADKDLPYINSLLKKFGGLYVLITEAMMKHQFSESHFSKNNADNGSGSVEDDPGSRERVNPDQNKNSVEPLHPSDHPQQTHYPDNETLTVEYGNHLIENIDPQRLNELCSKKSIEGTKQEFEDIVLKFDQNEPKLRAMLSIQPLREGREFITNHCLHRLNALDNLREAQFQSEQTNQQTKENQAKGKALMSLMEIQKHSDLLESFDSSSFSTDTTAQVDPPQTSKEHLEQRYEAVRKFISKSSDSNYLNKMEGGFNACMKKITSYTPDERANSNGQIYEQKKVLELKQYAHYYLLWMEEKYLNQGR